MERSVSGSILFFTDIFILFDAILSLKNNTRCLSTHCWVFFPKARTQLKYNGIVLNPHNIILGVVHILRYQLRGGGGGGGFLMITLV